MTGGPRTGGRRRALRPEEHVQGVLAGDRGVLARTITLIESTRPDHQAMAQEVLTRLLPMTGKAQRVGITGVPGVGKSTLIDALGCRLLQHGHKVAVLALDPSSTRSGGAILGDKTRMARLATEADAFIRPSPTAGHLGGVARMTRETILVCEAAGFDVVIVETVGVGQSETLVAEMVDCFLALMLPGAGDALQGIKKGLIELADMIAINKADGDNRLRAQQAATHYEQALAIIEPLSAAWRPPVLTVSARTGESLDRLWAIIKAHHDALEGAGELAGKRRAQQVRWMWSMLEARLRQALREHPAVRRLLDETETSVAEGRITPSAAVERILTAFQGTAPRDGSR